MKHIQRNREELVGIEPTQIHHEPFFILKNFSGSVFRIQFWIFFCDFWIDFIFCEMLCYLLFMKCADCLSAFA